MLKQTYRVTVFPIKPEPCPPSSRRNILPHVNSSYLKRCEFSRLTDPHCPIFRLKHIVSEAGEDFQDMAVKVNRMIVVFLYWNSLFKFLYGLPPVYMSHKQDVSQYSPQVPGLLSDSHSHSQCNVCIFMFSVVVPYHKAKTFLASVLCAAIKVYHGS